MPSSRCLGQVVVAIAVGAAESVAHAQDRITISGQVTDPDGAAAVSSPTPGHLTIGEAVAPISIGGPLPDGVTGATLHDSITMPGYILEQGELSVDGAGWATSCDPVTLSSRFPNLELTGRDDLRPGLSDTVVASLLLTGTFGDTTLQRANVISLHGQEISVASAPHASPPGRASGRLP